MRISSCKCPIGKVILSLNFFWCRVQQLGRRKSVRRVRDIKACYIMSADYELNNPQLPSCPGLSDRAVYLLSPSPAQLKVESYLSLLASSSNITFTSTQKRRWLQWPHWPRILLGISSFSSHLSRPVVYWVYFLLHFGCFSSQNLTWRWRNDCLLDARSSLGRACCWIRGCYSWCSQIWEVDADDCAEEFQQFKDSLKARQAR